MCSIQPPSSYNGFHIPPTMCSKGIGIAIKHASVISKEEEATLWHSGILSLDNPEGLLNAVFYYNGIHFVLRGREEHRNLCISQLSRYNDYWEYLENTSKNHPVGLNIMSIEGKTVCFHAATFQSWTNISISRQKKPLPRMSST